jgi:hypothetical protein
VNEFDLIDHSQFTHDGGADQPVEVTPGDKPIFPCGHPKLPSTKVYPGRKDKQAGHLKQPVVSRTTAARRTIFDAVAMDVRG